MADKKPFRLRATHTEALKLLIAGLPQKMVGEMVGVSVSTIKSWLDKPAFLAAYLAGVREQAFRVGVQGFSVLTELMSDKKVSDSIRMKAAAVATSRWLRMEEITGKAQQRKPAIEKQYTDLSQIGFKGSAVPALPEKNATPEPDEADPRDPLGLAAEDEGEDDNE